MSGNTSALGSTLARLRGALDAVYREMLKFGTVGAVAFVVDVGLFNVLATSLWPGADPAPLDGHEKMAKVVSASVATVVAWLGNRYWTFRHRRQASRPREFATFALMNAIAMVIAVACLTISHDVLGFTSPLADNIAGNVVGIGLGTLFRFWAYRTFVFTHFAEPDGPTAATSATATAPGTGATAVELPAEEGPLAGADVPDEGIRPVDLASELAAEIEALHRESAQVPTDRR